MMTAREQFKTEIMHSRHLLKRGAIMTGIAFPLACILGPSSVAFPILNWIGFPIAIFGIWGFMTWVYSIARLRKRIVCPSCGKSLSYLLTDPNYSKRFVQFGIPSDLPKEVDACPYCKLNLNEEPNGAQNTILEAISNSADAV